VPQHDYDPNSYCTDGFNGCFGDSNPGAWWNVTNDPFEAGESPLWAFSKYRALNRLALRTNLQVSVARAKTSLASPGSATLDDYLAYEGYNCYSGHGGTEIDTDPVTGLTAEQCAQRCTDDSYCHCVTYCAKDSGACAGGQGNCWKRANCYPNIFEHDSATDPFTVFIKKNKPAPPDAGAIAYLKHDSMGPQGDAAIMIFNPGEAANVTIDLSMLPAALFGIVPQDLLSYDGSEQSGVPPLAKSWTVEMQAKDMKFFSGFSLGVFAPRQGKKTGCRADDQYIKKALATTMQGCFLECLGNSQCENVFIDHVDLNWMETPPSLSCTLLGKLENPGTACSEGTGTLIKRLPGARSCANDWLSFGEVLAPVPGAPYMSPGQPSPLCEGGSLVDFV
jgi:hypothetical protein